MSEQIIPENEVFDRVRDVLCEVLNVKPEQIGQAEALVAAVQQAAGMAT